MTVYVDFGLSYLIQSSDTEIFVCCPQNYDFYLIKLELIVPNNKLSAEMNHNLLKNLKMGM